MPCYNWSGIFIGIDFDPNERHRVFDDRQFENAILTQIRANLIKDSIVLSSLTENGHLAGNTIENILDDDESQAYPDSKQGWF